MKKENLTLASLTYLFRTLVLSGCKTPNMNILVLDVSKQRKEVT